MNTINTKLSIFLPRTQDLLDEARDFLKSTDNLKLIEYASQIPVAAADGNKKINIAFAGRYSAGKSSLLTILTGVELKIGEGIVTSKTQKLDWHGINVWDTPGLMTEIRPEHDAMTKKLLSEVDLVVYVITSELFEPCVLKDFRDLAFSLDRKEEMMLVVNKMRNAGNSEAERRIKYQNLSENLYPASPDDFHVTFVDAKSWLGAQNETDEYYKAKKIKASNIEELTANLDAFTETRGWLGRFTSTLYSLEHILQEALNSLPSGDFEVDASREYLTREKNMYMDCERNLLQRVSGEIEEFLNFSVGQANELANILEPGLTQEQFNSKEKDCIYAVEQKQNMLIASVDKIIFDESQILKKRLSELENGDFAQNLSEKLNIRLRKMDSFMSDRTKKGIKKSSDIADQMGKWLQANTVGKKAGKAGLQGVSGSNVHETVLKIGNMLGHKFKPYEALKWTKGLKVAGTVLSVVGIVVSVGMEVANDAEQDKISNNLRKNRGDVRKHFEDWARDIRKNITENITKMIQDEIKPRIDDCNSRLDELEKMNHENETIRLRLVDLRRKTNLLLCEIHRNC